MKKIIALSFVLIFVLSLVACGKTVSDMTSGAQSMGDSIISGTQSATDEIISGVESAVDSAKKSINLMAGITATEAKKAALKHAGVEESQISDVDIDLDRDNGRLIYEVDFNAGNTEYDYDIDAQTGEVISADKSKD